MAKRKQPAQGGVKQDDRLFTLEVCIISGPMTENFIRKNKSVSRTIQIRGDQTLEDLHGAIFAAFDREEEHLYEFQVGGKGPMDPQARSYALPIDFKDRMPGTPRPAGVVTRTAIGSLGLKKDDVFGYWFDFGDDWWHQIDVMDIEEQAGIGKYPKVTGRVGESPPQYEDEEEEEEEEERESVEIPADYDPAKLLAEVPKAFAARFTELIALMDAFCDTHLNDEYKDLCRKMAFVLCLMRSPVLKGKVEGWAAGIVCTLGRVNFLGAPSQTPHMKQSEIAEGFGVSPATTYSRMKIIWNRLDLIQLHHDWCLPSLLDKNPLVWMLEVNGLLMDIRLAPREAQVVAFEQGLIPYIPADRKEAAGNDAERPPRLP